MNKSNYKKYAEKKAAKSNVLLNCIKAFFVGGLICAIGQALYLMYVYFGFGETDVKTLVPVTLILAASLLTGFGIFDKIAKFAGAGTLVPITGFANAVVSPAIDTKTEGLIIGLGAKIFAVAGPVILYGTLSSFIYGIILYAAKRFM